MLEVGRRILYDKSNGEILVYFGEMQGDIVPRKEISESDIGLLELEYGQHRDEFSRAISVKVDIQTKELEFELKPNQQTPEDRIEELENQLLIAEGVI